MVFTSGRSNRREKTWNTITAVQQGSHLFENAIISRLVDEQGKESQADEAATSCAPFADMSHNVTRRCDTWHLRVNFPPMTGIETMLLLSNKDATT